MLWHALEAPRASNEYPQHIFLLRNKKDISIFRMKKKAPYLLLYPYFSKTTIKTTCLKIGPNQKKKKKVNIFVEKNIELAIRCNEHTLCLRRL